MIMPRTTTSHAHRDPSVCDLRTLARCLNEDGLGPAIRRTRQAETGITRTPRPLLTPTDRPVEVRAPH